MQKLFSLCIAALMSVTVFAQEPTVVTAETTTMTSGSYVVNSDVTISSRITVTGEVTLYLNEGFTLTAGKGIELSEGNQLTIEGPGTLTATGEDGQGSDYTTPGIGAYSVGTLIINGGTVNATGGNHPSSNVGSAGIGGASHNNKGGTIIINGGTVNATGRAGGAGIGGGGSDWEGPYGMAGNITINGGKVTATSTGDGPGIGYGAQIGGYGTGRQGALTLSWTEVDDFIRVSTYALPTDGLTLAKGFFDEERGVHTNEEPGSLDGKKLTPYKGVITITAYNQKVPFDYSAPIHSVYYTGLLEGEKLDEQTTGTLQIACDYAQGYPLGSYPIIPSGLSSATYEVEFVNGTLQVVNPYVVTSATTTMKNDCYLVNSNVTISDRITITGEVTLYLNEGFTLTAGKGIELSEGNQLTIEGYGTLTANGTDGYSGDATTSGIGAYSVGTLIINGGTVNATGGDASFPLDGSAGIGGSVHNNKGGTIIINGGTVNATGRAGGAGIGGGGNSWEGPYGMAGNISINGGKVTAIGEGAGPGIGYGAQADNLEAGKQGTLTLSWTEVDDFVKASKYELPEGNLTLFKKFIDESSVIHTPDNPGALDGKKLMAYWADTPTDLDDLVNRQSSIRKFIRDGQLFILRDDKMYTITGARVQ